MSNVLAANWRVLPELAQHLSFPQFCKLVGRNVFSLHHTYFLAINLDRLPPHPCQRLGGGALERLQAADLDLLLKQGQSLEPEEKDQLLLRVRFFHAGFTHGYALKEGSTFAYLQWMIYPSENELLRKHYTGRYLPLTSRQVMLEKAYAFPAFRGRGFHPAVTAELLRLARQEGYKQGVTYIRKDNFVSLNNFIPLGFKITRLLREYKVLGYSFISG